MRRTITSFVRCAGVGFAALSAFSLPASAGAQDGGYSIFQGTMADMTWPEVDAAAKSGAVAIWGLAVIEEHGPALPLATDTYGVTASARAVREELRQDGVESVIVPPYYWGVNIATGNFPGTFNTRPEIMAEVISDVIGSLKKAGFTKVYCLSGHGDTEHNKAIMAGVRKAREVNGIEVFMVADAGLLQRISVAIDDSAVALIESTPPAGPPPKYIDGHSGAGETSTMMAVFPEVVRLDIVPNLKATNLGPADLAKWRQSAEAGREITPLGYFGQPAEASVEVGKERLAENARRIGVAIQRSIRSRETAGKPKED